jgi:hypothetical protein
MEAQENQAARIASADLLNEVHEDIEMIGMAMEGIATRDESLCPALFGLCRCLENVERKLKAVRVFLVV